MSLIRLLLQKSRGLVALGIVAGAASGLANAALIALAHRALSRDPVAPEPLLASFAGLALLVPLTQVGSEMAMAYLGQRLGLDLMLHLCRRILAAPLRQVEEVGPARLLANLTEDLGAVVQACVQVPAILMQIALIVGSFVYLQWLAWYAALVVLAFVAVGVASHRLALRRALRFLERAREHQDALLQHFRAVTEGIKELKLHGPRRRELLAGDLRSTAEAARRDEVWGNAIHAVVSSWTALLFFALLGALVFWLPAAAGLTRQAVTGYAFLLLFMLSPMNVLIELVPNLGRAGIALRKIRSSGLALEAGGEVQLERPAPALGWRTIELAGVEHTFAGDEEDGSRFTLGPLDITLRAGELVFLTGGNGSGKTTLGKLLTGLYVPDAGELRLDGRPVTDENRDAYRQLFSAVFWDYHLFDSLLGLDGEGLDERARALLAELELDRKLTISGGRLSTLDLSTGQRKRLALLTACLEDRPVHLFDEWAADQDPRFKEIFYGALLPELRARGKSVFVITHDDRYFGVADRVVQLTDGRISCDSAEEKAPAALSALGKAG